MLMTWKTESVLTWNSTNLTQTGLAPKSGNSCSIEGQDLIEFFKNYLEDTSNPSKLKLADCMFELL